MRLSFFPLPQLRAEQVVIGTQPEVRIAAVKATPELGSLVSERKVFKTVELQGLNLSREHLAGVLWGKGADSAMRIDRVVAKGMKLDVPGLALPPLDAQLAFKAGTVESATIEAPDGALLIRLDIKGARTDARIEAKRLTLPFGGIVQFEDFSGRGTLTPSELVLTEFEASALGGSIGGNARVRWQPSWTLDGEIAARGMDAGKVAGPLIAGGRLAGRAAYTMKASTPDKLEPSARLDGSFTVQKGSLGTVDLTRILQGASATGGTTLFSEMSGSVVLETGRIHARQVRLVAGLLNATGAADMDAQKNLSGRFLVELRAQASQARSGLVLSGSVSAPDFRRQ